MANYHEINIQNLVIKMLNNDENAKKVIIEHYTKYIDKIIESNFNEFDCDKNKFKEDMLKIVYRSIENYKIEQNEYFSHYITRKIIQYYNNEYRKLKNSEEYKNREIQKLAIKMLNGDMESLNKIIEFYSYHIRLLAKTRYNYTNFDEDDLVQIGLIGLLKAINLYNQNDKHAFSTYANSYINKEISAEINKYNKNLHPEYIGLNNNYNKIAFTDFIENEEIKNLILELSDTKRKILYLYFWKKYSFKEIGNILGFTESNAHLQYKNALKVLKKELLSTDVEQKKL